MKLSGSSALSAERVIEEHRQPAAEQDEFLKTVKQGFEGDREKLGVSVGRKRQAVVVRLSNQETNKHSFPLFHPYSQGLMFWQVLLVILILYTMIFVPYELCFGSCARSVGTAVVDDVSDVFFIMDILIQANTMIVVEEKHKDRTLLIARVFVICPYPFCSFARNGAPENF